MTAKHGDLDPMTMIALSYLILPPISLPIFHFPHSPLVPFPGPSLHLEYLHTSPFLQMCSKFTLFCQTSLSNGSQGWSFPSSYPTRVKGIFHTVLFYPWILEIFFFLLEVHVLAPQ